MVAFYQWVEIRRLKSCFAWVSALSFVLFLFFFFFFSSRRRHTRCSRDWSSDVCSSDLRPVQRISKPLAERTASGLEIRCTGLVWAGGQQSAPGRVTAQLQQRGEFIEWDVTAEMDQPIKAVTSVIRDVPRGQVSAAGSEPFDPRDNELLYGYPFGGGDLFGGNTAWGLSTPLVIVQRAEGDCVFLSSLDDRVRAKRFFFQPGEQAYRLEAVFEAEGWIDQTTVRVPTWRLGRSKTLDDAVQAHTTHLEHAYHLEPWETRRDAPDWERRTALDVTLHVMHYTGNG